MKLAFFCGRIFSCFYVFVVSKSARKIFVKLTTGVNLINILCGRILRQYFCAKNYKAEM